MPKQTKKKQETKKAEHKLTAQQAMGPPKPSRPAPKKGKIHPRDDEGLLDRLMDLILKDEK